MPYPFNFAAGEALDNFRDVVDPNVIDVWPLKELDGPFVHSEAFLVEVVSLQESCEVQDSLWRRNLKIKDTLVRDLGLFEGATVFEQV